ncbi:MAG: hypothetical protein V1908_01890 [Candidatus Peregrinibacteria bacterium]
MVTNGINLSKKGFKKQKTAMALTGFVLMGVFYVALLADFPTVHAVETMYMTSGSFTGNGVDNRVITGIGFRPDVVIIKGNVAQVAVIRTSTMTGDIAKPMLGDVAVGSNMIQNLLSDGFEVGTDARVNMSGIPYYWIAFKGAPGELKVGTYLGTGVARSIAGVGFSPELVMIMSEAARAQVFRSSTMSTSYRWDDAGGYAGRIDSLNPDGFSVGTNESSNATGIRYHYIAWNQIAGRINMGSYAGSGIDNRSITGAGFTPEYVLLKPSTTTKGTHKSASTEVGVDTTLNFYAATNSSNVIQALQADGFQVGSSAGSNATRVTYHWISFKKSLPPPIVKSLSVDIVDASGNPIASPSVSFSPIIFSFDPQQSSGTLGIASQKIRVTNTTTNPVWTLTLAATDGSTALWSVGGDRYDFNDSLTSGDDTDADIVGGKLTVNVTKSILVTPVAPCASMAGIAAGSNNSFKEITPSISSITLLQAGVLTTTNCAWDVTGVGLVQTIPASQPAGTYQLSFTLTVL